MSRQIGKKFIKALKALEKSGEVEQIASLFSANAEVYNTATFDTSNKLDPRQFWTNYRAPFRQIKSVFRNQIYGKKTAALEWMTVALTEDGCDIAYEGVSILETDGQQIIRFFAYFNPNKIARQITLETAVGKEA